MMIKDNEQRHPTTSGRGTHSTSTGCRGGDFNAYLAYTASCGDKPMDISVLNPSQTSTVPIQRRGMD